MVDGLKYVILLCLEGVLCLLFQQVLIEVGMCCVHVRQQEQEADAQRAAAQYDPSNEAKV